MSISAFAFPKPTDNEKKNNQNAVKYTDNEKQNTKEKTQQAYGKSDAENQMNEYHKASVATTKTMKSPKIDVQNMRERKKS